MVGDKKLNTLQGQLGAMNVEKIEVEKEETETQRFEFP